MAEYYRVREAFAYGDLVAGQGEIWSDDNPAYKGREQFFEPVSAAAARTTETASAAPGELRATPTVRRRKRATQAPTPPEPTPSTEGENSDA